MSEEDEHRAAVAHRAAADGAATAAEFTDDLAVETKTTPTDLVTAADRRAQERVVERIRAAYPDDPVVAEEDASETRDELPAAGPAWVVDPIDGTRNFVSGLPTWVTAVGFVRDREPVVGAVVAPVSGVTHVGGDQTRRNGRVVSTSGAEAPGLCRVAPLFWWPSEERPAEWTAFREAVTRFDGAIRVACAQWTLAAVADGAIEGAFTNRRPTPWDALAGVALIRGAGGRVTDLDGDRWTPDSEGLVASNGVAAVHEELLAAAEAAADAVDG